MRDGKSAGGSRLPNKAFEGHRPGPSEEVRKRAGHRDQGVGGSEWKGGGACMKYTNVDSVHLVRSSYLRAPKRGNMF